MKYDLKKLAKEISRAAKEISSSNIYKDYLIEGTYQDTIYVKSDSGFESIIIGNTESGNKGYMYLWSKDGASKNDFPKASEIEKLLKDVLNEKTLEEGEDKACYFRWDEYGTLDQQKKYFSDIVKRMSLVG